MPIPSRAGEIEAWGRGIERPKIAQRLAEQRPPGLAPLNLCLQVDLSGEAGKSGVAPDEVPALTHAVATLAAASAGRIRLHGLMRISAPATEPAAQRAPHRELRELLSALAGQGLALDTLLMGMSADLDAAVAEGAPRRAASHCYSRWPTSSCAQWRWCLNCSVWAERRLHAPQERHEGSNHAGKSSFRPFNDRCVALDELEASAGQSTASLRQSA